MSKTTMTATEETELPAIRDTRVMYPCGCGESDIMVTYYDALGKRIDQTWIHQGKVLREGTTKTAPQECFCNPCYDRKFICQTCSKRKPPGSYGQYCPPCRAKKDANVKQQVQATWDRTKFADGSLDIFIDGTCDVLAQPPENFQGATWDSLSPKVQHELTPVITRKTNAAVIYGPFKTGKTYTTWAMLYGLYVTNTHKVPKVCYVSWGQLCETASQMRVYGEVGPMAYRRMNQFEDCDVLVVDEFGTREVDAHQFKVIQNLINERYNDGLKKLTVVATTKNRAEMEETLDKGICRRVWDGVNVYLKKVYE